MRATVYGEELKPLREFIRDMITQYQTSLGLVSLFPRDSGSRFKKRPAVGRGQANYRARRGANEPATDIAADTFFWCTYVGFPTRIWTRK